MSYTRKQYMDHECTHEEYYAQFVTDSILRSVAFSIGVDRIKASKDPHMNDIPLAMWDRLSDAIRPASSPYSDGKKYYSLGEGVCILKAAARQLKAK